MISVAIVECRYTECHYAECRGAVHGKLFLPSLYLRVRREAGKARVAPGHTGKD
jgi:hypothetical protein